MWEQEYQRKKEIPPILDPEIFPEYERAGFRDLLVDLYNDPNPRVRAQYREILNTDASIIMENAARESIRDGRRLVVLCTGGAGLGKSVGLLTLWINWQELFQDETGIRPDIPFENNTYDWCSNNYIGTNENVRKARQLSIAENRKVVIFNMQDENPFLTGADRKAGKEDFINNITNLRFKRHFFGICSCDFDTDFINKMSFRLEIIARNKKLATSLWLFYDKYNRPIGWVIIMMRLDRKDVYDHYDAMKATYQDKAEAQGGTFSATSDANTQGDAERIFLKLKEVYGDEPKFANKFVYDAAIRGGVGLSTVKQKCEPVVLRVQELWNRWKAGEGRMSSRRVATIAEKRIQVEPAEPKPKGHGQYENNNIKGIKFEQEFNDSIAPKFFDDGLFLWTAQDKKDAKLPDFIGLKDGCPTAVDVKDYAVRAGDVVRRSDLQAVMDMVIAWRHNLGEGGITGCRGEPKAILYMRDSKNHPGRTWIEGVDPDNHHQKITIRLNTPKREPLKD